MKMALSYIHINFCPDSLRSRRPFLCILFILLLLLQPHSTTAEVTAAGTETNGGNNAPDRVFLRSITALVFSITGRARTHSGIGRPELECVGGSASGFWWKSEYYPHNVQCRNIGWDGSSVQWSCHAPLVDGVLFGADTKVSCEPFEQGKDDGYVLKDSCRLEYTLNFTKFTLSFAHIIYGTLSMVLLHDAQRGSIDTLVQQLGVCNQTKFLTAFHYHSCCL